MQPLTSVKLNLYEQIGYLMTGAVALMLIFLNFHLVYPNSKLFQFNLGQSVLVFLGAYTIGHLTQALSNYLIPYPHKSFSALEKKILKRVRNYLKLDCGDEQTMGFAMMLAQTSDSTGQVGAFNANYGLYRGWAIIFFCQAIAVAVIAEFNPSIWGAPWGQIWLEIIAVVSAIISWLFLQRAIRFNRYYRSKVFQVVTIKLSTEGH